MENGLRAEMYDAKNGQELSKKFGERLEKRRKVW
jgi:hypothetical protein